MDGIKDLRARRARELGDKKEEYLNELRKEYTIQSVAKYDDLLQTIRHIMNKLKLFDCTEFVQGLETSWEINNVTPECFDEYDLLKHSIMLKWGERDIKKIKARGYEKKL